MLVSLTPKGLNIPAQGAALGWYVPPLQGGFQGIYIKKFPDYWGENGTWRCSDLSMPGSHFRDCCYC